MHPERCFGGLHRVDDTSSYLFAQSLGSTITSAALSLGPQEPNFEAGSQHALIIIFNYVKVGNFSPK